MTQPFLVVNPKAYLTGDALLSLAQGADQMAATSPVDIYFTAPFTELARIERETKYIKVTAQHMDANEPGRGMGHVSAEALTDINIRATFLNHAEYPLTLSVLAQTITRAKAQGITTIVCADSPEEAVAVSQLNPTIVLAEPTALIGTGQAPNDDYIKTTIAQIRAANPDVQVMIASGVSSAEDVRRVMRLGADGTGATSGIIKKADPVQEIVDWVQAIIQARSETA